MKDTNNNQPTFWQALGQGFNNIWQGATGTVLGIGQQTQAAAQQTAANAAATTQILQMQEAERQARQRTILLLIILGFVLPVIGVTIFVIAKG